MLEDSQIGLIISALNKKFEEQEQKHKTAIREIQSLCSHTNLVSVMAGKKCTVCGAFIKDKDKLQRYVLVNNK